MTSNALEVDNLSLSVGPTPILRDVTFTVAAGEAVGLVGESGSGKSMTLRSIARLLPDQAHATGTIKIGGVDVSTLGGAALRTLRGTELGFVFQDPRSAINPMHRVGDFLLEVARDKHRDLRAAAARAEELLGRMGIPEPRRRMRQYPAELSGGLLQRVMIAAALMDRPSLLLADEPTTALDVTTQSDVLALVDELRREQQTAMVFVTHDLDLALAICDRVVVLYAGQIMELAPASWFAGTPLHPYTRGLFASRPPLSRRLDPIPTIEGVPAGLADAAEGCPFRARCPIAQDRCRASLPPLSTVGPAHVRCHRIEEIIGGQLTGEIPLGVADRIPTEAGT